MALRDDALRIWQAGVAAVDSARLVLDALSVTADSLRIGDTYIPRQKLRHLEVLGAGKAGAGMAAGVQQALAPASDWLSWSGWVNVPSDCVRPLPHIHLHPARPAGVNEPTPAGVTGTQEILRRITALTAQDVCLMLISGGGSALLCLPVPEISLADKLAVTRALAADGAPIQELNCVRTQLSLVKGGRLAAACHARLLITLIISDVIGDPLPIIASGPTVAGHSSPAAALRILQQRGLLDGRIPATVVDYLRSRDNHDKAVAAGIRADTIRQHPAGTCTVINRIIGNNHTALTAAAREAAALGYQVVSLGSDNQRSAADEGRRLLTELQVLRSTAAARSGADTAAGICLLSGGEPTVQLAPVSCPRKGGRNQELVLAAIAALPQPEDWRGMVLLSGGTDGEDGPTDAAGAVADEQLLQRLAASGLEPDRYLAINNSYPFFEQLQGLLRTGPTHTNVMDLRVGLVRTA